MLVPLPGIPSLHAYQHQPSLQILSLMTLEAVAIPHSKALQISWHGPPPLDCSLVQGKALASFLWAI